MQAKVFVLVQEHYYLPPDENDLCAATPLAVYESSAIAEKEADGHAARHRTKFGGNVKEYGRGTREYRVWIDSENANADRFVWVVREVDYFKRPKMK